MRIKVEEVFRSMKDLKKFVDTFSEVDLTDISVSESKYAAGAVMQWIATIEFVPYKVEQIECGEHLPGPGEPYPKDLLVINHECQS